MRISHGIECVRHAARWPAAMLVVIATAISAGSVSIATAATTPVLQAVNVAGFTGVLANSAGMTMYVLNTEKDGVIHCHPYCLKTWVPLEVPNSTSSIAVGPGVNGAIGFVPRTATRKQVTFNSYPLYRYIKDTAPGQAGGEGLLTYAGTWLVVDAAATTASHTPVYPTLESTNAGSFTGVLANHLSRSLYLFSIEKGSTVHCTGTCLKTWIPLEVHSKTTPITIGRSVNGHVGYVTRGTNLFQLTYNTYPIYTYVHDTAVGQTKGEGVATNGGTWYLVRASATTAADTPILPA